MRNKLTTTLILKSIILCTASNLLISCDSGGTVIYNIPTPTPSPTPALATINISQLSATSVTRAGGSVTIQAILDKNVEQIQAITLKTNNSNDNINISSQPK